MSNRKIFDLITSHWLYAKEKAGERYSSELNIDFSLINYFSAITVDDKFFSMFSELKRNLEECVKRTYLRRIVDLKIGSVKDLQFLEEKLSKLIKKIESITKQELNMPSKIDLSDIQNLSAELSDIVSKLIDKNRTIQKENSEITDNEKNEYQYFSNDFSRLLSEIRRIQALVEDRTIKHANNPYSFVSGSAGSGKTHLLCEFVRKKVEEQRKPALLFLGEWFSKPFNNIKSEIASILKLSEKNLLKDLNDYAIRNKTRFAICIDAINEGHRASWQKSLMEFLNEIKRYPGLALIVTCRTPFEKVILPELEKSNFIHSFHAGFSEDEQSEAISKYFTKYKIPLPEVPLLNPEFSNPLFLKLFCEAIEKVTVKNKHKQIKEISAGQKGMTHILEFFIKQKSKKISTRTGIQSQLVWKIIKEEIVFVMASRKKDKISLKETKRILNRCQPTGLRKNILLEELINETILSEDVIYYKGKYREVIRFTYQRFSDHLIARYLLQSLKGKKRKNEIKNILRNKTAIGSYFSRSGRRKIDENYNIITALMVEFPTRIGNKGELMDYLDWKSYPVEFCRAFIDGLYWRDPRMINKSTSVWIGKLLNFDPLKDETFNLLLALSVKPKHPLSGKILNKYLARIPMSQRDVFWTEYLRRNLVYNTPARVIEWGYNLLKRKISKIYIKNYLEILAWFLTTTQRGTRDKVTKLLYLIGRRHPQQLFNKTLQSLEFNDPYVPERLLAASYGVVLSLNYSRSLLFRRKILPSFVINLFKKIFDVDTPKGTTHILMRDYARGIVQSALALNPALLNTRQKDLIDPPYIKGGIRDWQEEADHDEGKYRDGNMPLHMDFENYTLGRLVPGRRNYDSNNSEYKKVLGQIYWRIYKLGYSLEKFGEIDKLIGRNAFYSEMNGNESKKTDRYGKKYCWIAFFELCGYRNDEGLLRLQPNERISDADLDPSFPEYIEYPKLNNTPLIQHKGTLEEWIMKGGNPKVDHLIQRKRIGKEQGDWIVLEGFTEDLEKNKRIFIFLRGLIVKEENTKDVIKAISSLEYPGNHAIPEAESEYYSFAGEINDLNTWNYRQFPAKITTEKGEIELEIPVIQYAWESYHSGENKVGGVKLLSMEMMTKLNLFIQTPRLLVREKNTGKKVALFINSGEFHNSHESFTYINKDTLDKYLQITKSKLIIVVWGEREPAEYEDPEFEKIRKGKYRHHEMIHKQIYIYERYSNNPKKII